jgi:hypothetical protein
MRSPRSSTPSSGLLLGTTFEPRKYRSDVRIRSAAGDVPGRHLLPVDEARA